MSELTTILIGAAHVVVGLACVVLGSDLIRDTIDDIMTAKETQYGVLIEYDAIRTSPTDVVKEKTDEAPIPAVQNIIPSQVEATPCCKKEHVSCAKCGFDQCINCPTMYGKEIGNIFWTCTPTNMEKMFSQSCRVGNGVSSYCWMVDKTDMEKETFADNNFNNKGILTNI